MTVSTIRMRGECLIVATLAGFSDEALRQELERRTASAAPTTNQHHAHGTQGMMLASVPPGTHAGARAGTAGEELHEVIALADFDSHALIDELGSRPNFHHTMREASGHCLIDLDTARDLLDAVERQDFAAIQGRLLQLLPAQAMRHLTATA